ncbi:hypothetical protein AAVH_01446 [Aphelenchoides avenae]|nr:hypothetical protein AAVH_01446 [Aphelenchus avenae]
MVNSCSNNEDLPPNRRSDDEDNEYLQDGWHIGYEVQMEGLGIVNVYGESDGEMSDGYEGPGESDEETAEIRRAGYQTLPAVVGEESDDEPNNADSEALSNTPIPGPSASNASAMLTCIRKDFEAALSEAAQVHQVGACPSPKVDGQEITLTDDKIDEIKSAMQQMRIEPPPWAGRIPDSQLCELVKNLKKN